MPSAEPIGTGTETDRINLKRILIPIDFSDQSKNALEYSISVARQFNAELILVYVVEPAVYPTDFGFGRGGISALESDMRKGGKIELEKLIESKAKGKVIARALVKTGRPFREIIKTADKEEVDLIIIPTHGHTGMENILFGSTAESVIRHANCPVLTWRASYGKAEKGRR
jgi:universal stress protein A